MGKNIVILGWFGCGNIGDDCILDNEIKIIRSKYPKSEITIFCGKKQNFELLYKNVICMPIPPISFYRFYKFFNIFYSYRLYQTFKDTDIFVLGGGGFFSDRQFFAIAGWLRYCKIAKFFGAKVIGFGMGAGSFSYTYNKRLINKSSYVFDALIVRDTTSYDYLLETGFMEEKLLQSIDPAFFTPYIENKKKHVVGFILHSRESYFISEIKKIIKDTDYNIYLIISDDIDYKINSKIMHGVSSERCTLFEPKKSSDMVKIIGSCDFVVSQRLHGSIIAYTQKVPFLNIYYHHKGKELIKLLGISDFSLDSNTITNEKIVDYIKRKDNFSFQILEYAFYKNIFLHTI